MPESQPSLRQKIWKLAGDASTIQFLWQVTISVAAASRVVSVMPSNWYPPQYWLTGGAVLFGTWASVATIWVVGRWLELRVIRWWNPPALDITAQSGARSATITLLHSGSPATWIADGRIAEMLSDNLNPSPELFQVVLDKGGRLMKSIDLSDGEWAQFVIASERTSEWYPASFVVRRGNDDCMIPDSGAVVEIAFRRDGAKNLIRRFKVKRTRSEVHIENA
ncbi:MAG: hypothetical protein JWO13_2926 [Acidobacteriales bacterium]|nr:hypothetical protein [Terriglobales bacterium]